MALFPSDWYWSVVGGPAGVYASQRRIYVPTNDAGHQAFLVEGNNTSVIGSVAELRQLLNDAGYRYLNEPLPPLVFTGRPPVTVARCRLDSSANSVPTGAGGKFLPWDVERSDGLAMHDPALSERVVIPVDHAGVWRCTINVEFADPVLPTGLRRVSLTRGTGGSPEVLRTVRGVVSPVGNTALSLACSPTLAEGDVLRVFVEHAQALASVNVSGTWDLVREE